MRTLALPADPATFLLTPRPEVVDHFVFEPLPHGLALTDAVLVRAHQVGAGDLVIAEFTENWWAADRVAEHIPAPYPADPHTFTACPCEGCSECDDFDAYGFADPHTATDRDARWICLASSDQDEPCAVYFRNAPLAVIPAAAVQAATGQPTP